MDDHHFGYITKLTKKNTGPYKAGGVYTWKLTKMSWLNFCRNNARTSFGKFELFQDGLEKTFTTNHMGEEAFQTLIYVNVQLLQK